VWPSLAQNCAHYFGIDISENKLARICRTNRISGTTGANLVTAAHKLGFATRIIDSANFGMITAWLCKGVPVIVDWISTGHGRNSPVAIGHYSVVCGLTRDDIILEPGHWTKTSPVAPRFMRRLVIVGPPSFLDDTDQNPPGGLKVPSTSFQRGRLREHTSRIAVQKLGCTNFRGERPLLRRGICNDPNGW
jgi:hypothetical protein